MTCSWQNFSLVPGLQGLRLEVNGVAGKVWKGALIGASAGLVAAAVMNAVPAVWSLFEKSEPEQGGGEDATVKTAEKIAEPLLDRPLTTEEKKWGGPAVHYAFGASVGALYGALAPVAPVVTVGFGTVYATMVWLFGDELVVPKLGLAPPPGETPAMGHFKYWFMHAVYGLTLEGVRHLGEDELIP